MNELRYTLVANGSSDVALMPILTWLLKTHGVAYAIQAEWADLRQIHKPKRWKLADRIRLSLDLFPCDLLFVHRDAEREPRERRIGEIKQELEEVVRSYPVPPTVYVVPVRMQETRPNCTNVSGKQVVSVGTV